MLKDAPRRCRVVLGDDLETEWIRYTGPVVFETT